LGTALTREQVELLRRYTEHVVVIFDPDEAGRKALERSLQIFLAGGVQAKTVVLPEGYDPDDYVRKFGRESLEEIIAGAPSLVDYYIDHIIGKKDSLEDKRDAVREALSFISGLDDAIERNLFLKRISEKLGIDQEILKKEATRNMDLSPAPERVAADKKIEDGFDKVELSLILVMLEHPASIQQVEATGVLPYFICDDLRDLGGRIIAFAKNSSGNLSASSFLDCLPDGSLKTRIIQSLLAGETGNEEIIGRYLADTIKKVKNKWYERKNKNLSMELKKAQARGDHDYCDRLLLEKDRLSKEKKLI
jgi:DNA primase